MPRYYHDINYHHHAKIWRKAKKFIITFLLLVALVGGYIILDSNRQAQRASAPSDPTPETTAVFTTPVEVMRSQFFQFQTNKSWRLVSNESTASKFVYRSYNRNLLEQELVITVNDKEPVAAATRLLPVQRTEENTLLSAEVTEHCSKSVTNKSSPVPVRTNMESVEFTCDFQNGGAYTVAVGLKEGGSPMRLMRTDGTVATYGIFYRNVKFTPDANDLVTIVNSFRPI